MKLHLPKLLRVAVIAAVMGSATSFAVTLTKDNISYRQDDTTTPDVNEASSYLNVGMDNITDTWKGNLVVGDLEDVQGDVDNVGAFNDSWGFVTPNGGNSNKTITSSLKITGSLTLQGSGKIVLGGQSSSKYHGIEVTDSITVTGGSQKSTKIITNDLTITGGIVNTHTSNCNGGNSGLYAFSSNGKQSTIKNSLTQEGGEVVFGYTSKAQGIGVEGHCYVGFGTSGQSATITQSGGVMLFASDIAAQGGLEIEQETPKSDAQEQKMIIRDCLWLAGASAMNKEWSGTSGITQSSDIALMEIGKLATSDNNDTHVIDIKQTAKGTILVYGSSFAYKGIITLTQTGGGIISIGGGQSDDIFNRKYQASNGDVAINAQIDNEHYAIKPLHTDGFTSKNTTYVITQSSGTINIFGKGDVDQEGTYIALYGEHGLKKLRSTSCLSLDWVAAYGNTESDWNGTEWEQDSLQLNTRLNWNKKLTDRLCMSVFGGLEYFATVSDTVNGVKTGSIQNLRGELGVGARYVAWGAPGVYEMARAAW